MCRVRKSAAREPWVRPAQKSRNGPGPNMYVAPFAAVSASACPAGRLLGASTEAPDAAALGGEYCPSLAEQIS